MPKKIAINFDDARQKREKLRAKLRESLELLFLGQGRREPDAREMALIAVGDPLPMVEAGLDLSEAEMQLSRKLLRAFRLLFVAEGYSSTDAAAMARLATGHNPQLVRLLQNLKQETRRVMKQNHAAKLSNSRRSA